MIRCAIVDALIDANGHTNGEIARMRMPLSLVQYPVRSLIAGVLNLIHFVGTFSNHACRCHTGHVLDVFGMFCILTFFSLHQCCTILALEYQIAVSDAMFATLQGILCALAWTASQLFYSDPACEATEFCGFVVCCFPALLSHLLISSRYLHVQYSRPLLRGVFGALLVAAIAQWADQPRHVGMMFCQPESPVQLHGVWHLGTSSALLALYQCYRGVKATAAKKD